MSDLRFDAVFATLLAANDLGVGSGRLLPTTAAAVGLLSIFVGSVALARSGRGGAFFALAAGLVGAAIGGLHAANSAGGFGTGNGLAGAIVAIALGLIGMSLGGLALARYRTPAALTDSTE